MKRIKVKLSGKGTRDDPWRVNLPTYVMAVDYDVEGNPIDTMNTKNKTCDVLVPDDEVDAEGKIDEKRIREKYKEGWSKFKAEDAQ